MIDLTKAQRVLAFFAHPDDETLGAGGTIAKLRSLGVDVHVAIAATGITSRESSDSGQALDSLKADCKRAMGTLGVDVAHLELGHFRDNKMDTHALLDLIQWLEAIIAQVKPDLILTHHRYCTNIDHQYCHEAAVVATRPDINRHISIWAAEVPSSTGYLRPAAFEPNVYVDLDERFLEQKIQAMQCYSGESRPDPHPRSPEVLRAYAKVRGAESGCRHAEAFMIQRTFA